MTPVRADPPPPPASLEAVFHLLYAVWTEVGELRTLLAAERKDRYTVGEVAARCGRSEYTVRRWIAAGRLRAERVAGTGPRGRLLVPRSEFDTLIAAAKGGRMSEAALG